MWKAPTPFKQCVWRLMTAKNMLPMFLPVVHPRGWHIWGVSRCLNDNWIFSPYSFLSFHLKKYVISVKIKNCPPFSSYFNYGLYFFYCSLFVLNIFFISSLLFIFIINLFSPIPLWLWWFRESIERKSCFLCKLKSVWL